MFFFFLTVRTEGRLWYQDSGGNSPFTHRKFGMLGRQSVGLRELPSVILFKLRINTFILGWLGKIKQKNIPFLAWVKRHCCEKKNLMQTPQLPSLSFSSPLQAGENKNKIQSQKREEGPLLATFHVS